MDYSSDASTDDEYEKTIEGANDTHIDFFLPAVIGGIIVGQHIAKYCLKKPCRTSKLSGHQWMTEILEGHEKRCYEKFRMPLDVFLKLCTDLSTKYGLKPTRGFSIQEMVGIFLYSLGHGSGNRELQERFQYSGETISRHFHSVMKACIALSIDEIKPNDPTFSGIHPKLKRDVRYFPYFKNAIGAVDGTHIPAVVESHNLVRYIGRKGIPTQNVMAICDWDMCFIFAWAGWEGIAHDSRLLERALREDDVGFPKPPTGKYYLVDAGYPMPMGFLGPYKNERYHIPDFQRSAAFRNHNEVFNYYHSSLRSTIERTFGVWKKRFKILRAMPQYSYDTQVRLVICSMAIHNYIRRHALDADAEMQIIEQEEDDEQDEEIELDDFTAEEDLRSARTQRAMEVLRDHIRDRLVQDKANER